MNYYSKIFSKKLNTYRNFKESEKLVVKVNKIIESILKETKMKFYHKIYMPGTGKICLLLTNTQISKEFADELFFAGWIDGQTNKPTPLPKGWKEKIIDDELLLKIKSKYKI